MPNPKNKQRNTLFLLITLTIPVFFFLLLELVLRLGSYGQSYPLFVDAEGLPGYLQASTEVVKRYYNDPEDAPAVPIDTIYFSKQKPDDTFRIVVQGGSTAAGFPYGRWGGLAGMLYNRLEAVFPDRNIEVITTAMSAVNSYTMLDLVDEIIEIQPDAVLIYAGHNEYIGIMGAATSISSAQSRNATLLFLKLRNLRLYQLMQQLFSRFKSTPEIAESNDERGSLMARAASGREIPYQSEIFDQGVEQFSGNMRQILQSYQEADIPVILGTLVSNEMDQAPFISPEPEIDTANWKILWQQYQDQVTRQQLDKAIDTAKQLTEQFDTARDWFALAGAYRQHGDPANARIAYLRAKDLDQLRFRAPEEMNQVIRQLARQFSLPLADVQQYLASHTEDELIGHNLMLEHLHPNKRGYFLLAENYFYTLLATGIMGSATHRQSSQQAWAEVPITVIDDILAKHAINKLKAEYPFTDTPHKIKFPERIDTPTKLAYARHTGAQNWVANIQDLFDYHREQKDTVHMLVAAQMLAQASPDMRGPHYTTGRVFIALGDYPRAIRYLKNELASDPDNTDARKALMYAMINSKQKKQAQQQLVILRQQLGDDPAIQKFENALAQ